MTGLVRRVLLIGLLGLFALARDPPAVADDGFDPGNVLCHRLTITDNAPFRDLLHAWLRDAIARRSWPAMRGDIWFGADPVWTRNTKWYKRAWRESINRDLVQAAAIGDVNLITKLLREGADINVKANIDNLTSPLIWAARCDRAAAVRLLLEKGAYVDITGDDPGGVKSVTQGSTPLIWAAAFGHADIVRILLAHGANPNARETFILDIGKPWLKEKGTIPLVASANTETTGLLLQAKADPNSDGGHGVTPLMAAASRGDIEQCRLLLAWGANPRLKDRGGQTAADWAGDHQDIRDLLGSSK